MRHIFYTHSSRTTKKKENDDQRPRSIHGLERGARGRVGGQRETPRGTDGRRGGAGRASARRYYRRRLAISLPLSLEIFSSSSSLDLRDGVVDDDDDDVFVMR